MNDNTNWNDYREHLVPLTRALAAHVREHGPDLISVDGLGQLGRDNSTWWDFVLDGEAVSLPVPAELASMRPGMLMTMAQIAAAACRPHHGGYVAALRQLARFGIDDDVADALAEAGGRYFPAAQRPMLRAHELATISATRRAKVDAR